MARFETISLRYHLRCRCSVIFHSKRNTVMRKLSEASSLLQRSLPCCCFIVYSTFFPPAALVLLKGVKLCSHYRQHGYKAARSGQRHCRRVAFWGVAHGLLCENGDHGSSGESACGASGQRTLVNGKNTIFLHCLRGTGIEGRRAEVAKQKPMIGRRIIEALKKVEASSDLICNVLGRTFWLHVIGFHLKWLVAGCRQ